MGTDEIRFTDKRVDESWKERISGEKDSTSQPSKPSQSKTTRQPEATLKTNPLFVQLVTSLAMQALIQLGDIENPTTGTKSQDLDGARETIDLLLSLKAKTQGNLSQEEEKLMESALGDLQMKFVQLAGL